MDESEEHEEEVFVEQVKEPVLAKANEVPKETRLENVPEEKVPVSIVPSIKNMDEEKVITRLSFNNNDSVLDEHNTIQHVDAPKTLERLEEISSSRALERMLAKNDEDDSDEERLQISTEDFDITNGIDVLDTKNNGLGQIYDNEISLDIEEL